MIELPLETWMILTMKSKEKKLLNYVLDCPKLKSRWIILEITHRTISFLQIENDRKDKHIEELEGDLKTVSDIQNMENSQYLRHTLVKFLCYSSSSEQQMILPAVSELLNMKFVF